jgi:hypothetical protein
MDSSKRFGVWAIFRYMHSPKILWSYRYELMNHIMCIQCQLIFIPGFMVGNKLVPSQSWNSEISRFGVWPVPWKMVLREARNAYRWVHEIRLSTSAQFCNEFWHKSMPRWKLRMWPTPFYCRYRNEADTSGTNLEQRKIQLKRLKWNWGRVWRAPSHPYSSKWTLYRHVAENNQN